MGGKELMGAMLNDELLGQCATLGASLKQIRVAHAKAG